MNIYRIRCALQILGILILSSAVALGDEWQVVVNNGDTVPGDSRTFNSYNPPSLNIAQQVVFRARSKGGTGGQPAHGVYFRDMQTGGTPAIAIFDRNTVVPDPNNLAETFIEPPSIPRIDIWGDMIASRGVHPPVWRYYASDGSETRAGTTGIYANPFGTLITGASNLGEVPEFPFFAVPGIVSDFPDFADPGAGAVKFDVFPGAPAVVGSTIVFKGNYSLDNVSRTGVYYRDLQNAPAGGNLPSVLIANNGETFIPGTKILFGSTAPPSAAVGPPPNYHEQLVVFAGFDNEDNPTAGGIYLARLSGPNPPLLPLVEIGSQVPGEVNGTVFNRLGEGVSFDGRFVAFWGAWGEQQKNLVLQCPENGNRDRIEYCRKLYPHGFATSVPVFQGMFVHDILSGRTRAVAKTPGDFDDFVYWNFSGRVPNTGGGDDDGELARWRSAAFVAVSGLVDGVHTDPGYHAAFKARSGIVNPDTLSYIDPIDGIYLGNGPRLQRIQTLVETGMNGILFDPEAVDPETIDPAAAVDRIPLPVTEMGIERDGFRGDSIAVTVTMGTEEAGWAGIYLTTVR